MPQLVFKAVLAALAFGCAVPACADDVQTVPVRAGAHATYDRLVFDWPVPVTVTLDRRGPQAELVFSRGGDIKFGRPVSKEISRARNLSAKLDQPDHAKVSFTVDPAAQISFFASGNSVVVDISGKNAPAASLTAATVLPAPQPIPVPAPAPAENKALSLSLPPLVVPAAAAVAAIKDPTPPLVSETAALTTAAASAVPVAARSIVPGNLVLNETPSLVAALDAHVTTRAVIYQRADNGYIFFDRKLTLSAADLANGIKPLVDLKPIDMTQNSGFSFPVPQDSQLHATLDGTVWKIYLAKKSEDAPISTTLVAQPDFALGARFMLPLPDAPQPIRLTDPVVGDSLILLPLAQSEAFTVSRHLADFDILPAAQGMVIKPLTDKIVVRDVSDGIEIVGEGGLLLSRAVDTGAAQQSGGKARDAETGKSIFDFATWRGKADEPFVKTRQRLQQTIADVPEAERNRARLELARFYFARGNGNEAVALLDMLVKDVPDLRAHADFLSLLGAADILSYRPQEGLDALASPYLAGQPEVELWQAIGLAEQRDWAPAEEKFALTEPILAGYPEPFYSKFMILAIEAAVSVGKDRQASEWLNAFEKQPHLDSANPAMYYLRGVLHAKAGRAAAAEEAWKMPAHSRDQLYQVRAELALIDLGVATHSLTSAQAADRLEALRFGWRGDDLEVDILHRLGQFYIDAKNVKQGLAVLSQAVTLYPNSALAPQIHAEMQKIFYDVFLGDLGKKLSPLDSLTLYQQYRDLMPAGKDGDAVMHNLAERLVAIDLLDQAASLLDDLVKNHLHGDEKDQAALRLAAIRLLNHQPGEAIAALDIANTGHLNADAQNESNLLRARALSESHRENDALILLKDNNAQGARLLRADIAMHAQDWPGAAQSLMELVGPPPPSGRPLTARQAEWILNAALAYALANNQTELDRLAIDYGAAMAATSQSSTFRILTQPEKNGQLRDLAAAQSQLAQVDMFQGFLNSYRATPGDVAAAKP